jgi:hypothetical protein
LQVRENPSVSFGYYSTTADGSGLGFWRLMHDPAPAPPDAAWTRQRLASFEELRCAATASLKPLNLTAPLRP